ncbi:hypothetical protein PIB30_000798 [Stylosanthes scabra]|uniref:Uncharacterized protein n=1 Tax=Stylosanthes scabra TaxID=79078 RepID=A0ABU6Q295_9FABA|nr:hypothetical protein [Stylosanthes scabra]
MMIASPLFNGRFSFPSNNIIEPWLIDYGGNIVHNVAMCIGSQALVDEGNVKLFGAIYVHPYLYSSKAIGSESILVCVVGIDSIGDRGVWYYDAVNKSGWQGKSELFKEEGEDHVYRHIFHHEKAKKITDRTASFILH